MLWLATRIVDAANHDRDTGDGVKVGGHQASQRLAGHGDDRAVVRPPRRRRPGRGQAARLAGLPRDPVPARQPRPLLPDARCAPAAACSPTRAAPRTPTRSTSPPARSGLGAAAPLFAAVTRRYVDAHFGAAPALALRRDHRRRRARRGQHLGGGRRPGDRGPRQRDVARRLQPAVARPRRARRADRAVARPVRGGRLARRRGEVRPPARRRRSRGRAASALRDWIDEMPNEQYQSLFGLAGDDAAQAVPRRRAGRTSREFVADVADDELGAAGHRPRRARPRRAARGVPRSATRSRTGRASSSPTPSRAGACRSPATRATTRRCCPASRSTRCAPRSGSTPATEWDRLDPASPAGHVGRRAPRARWPGRRATASLAVAVPEATGVRAAQADLDPGGVRPGARRPGPRRGGRAVPRHHRARRRDVDQPGRLHQQDRRLRARPSGASWNEDRDAAWAEGPTGQHIELGISRDEPVPAARPARAVVGPVRPAAAAGRHRLRPVRAARPRRVHLRRRTPASRFVVAGTPSGVTLAPEGGAHQSTITASVGLELPGRHVHRAGVRRRAGLAALRRARPDRGGPPATSTAAPAEDGAYYFRLHDPADRPGAVRGGAGAARRRRAAPAGAGRRLPAGRRHRGAPGARRAARRWCTSSAPAPCCPRCSRPPPSWPTRGSPRTSSTSPRWTGSTRPGSGRCARACGRRPRRASPGALRTAFPDRAPIVTVHDAASHAMAWLGSALGVPCRAARASTSSASPASVARALRAARPAAGQHRQRRAGGACPWPEPADVRVRRRRPSRSERSARARGSGRRRPTRRSRRGGPAPCSSGRGPARRCAGARNPRRPRRPRPGM